MLLQPLALYKEAAPGITHLAAADEGCSKLPSCEPAGLSQPLVRLH